MQLIAPVKLLPLKPIYLVHGGEIWHSNDSINKIYNNYSNNNLKKYYFVNFLEFEKFQSNQNIELFNLDLFCNEAINKLIKIEINNGKFTKKQQEILLNLINNLNNSVVILCANKLDKTAFSSAWFASINKIGAIIVTKPLSVVGMQKWALEQFKQANLTINADALEQFVKLYQNNLLEASQIIDKLNLGNYKNIDLKLLLEFVSDESDFSVFDLQRALISKNIVQIIYILHKLKQQHLEEVLILWAIVKQIKNIMFNNIIAQRQKYCLLLPKAAEIDLAIKHVEYIDGKKAIDNKLHIWTLLVDLCLEACYL